MANALIEHKLKLLPDLPGCYEMLNYRNEIIYVGKSKDLKHRVRSYFKAHHTGKVGEMVSEVHNFHTIYVSNDKEAFLLEITLIQKYRPYFNIQLKQGHMGYPYIKITHERNPMITMTNKITNDGGYYFGPYPNITAASKTLRFLQRVYPLRRCHHTHGRPCLYYHMGQCLGSCFKTVPVSTYKRQIKRIKSFLNGNCASVKKKLTHQMLIASKKLNFTRAERIKKLLGYIEATVEKQKIISHDYTPRDIFNYYAQDGWICIQVFYLRQARLMKRVRRYYPVMNTPLETFLEFITQFYHNSKFLIPKSVLVPKQVPKKLLSKILHTNIKTPQRGQKHSLLLMARHNAEISLKTKFKLVELNPKDNMEVLKKLGKILNIPVPKTIDSVDLADIQGKDYAGSFIVFTNGHPDKKRYRKYKLRTVTHADENKGMHEVFLRRFSYMKKKHKKMPNLICVDGGIIQVRSAENVMYNELNLHIPIVGMVKDSHHRTNHLLIKSGNRYVNKYLPPNSPVFLFITHIQDEIHHFVINYYRNVHTHHSFHSPLLNINGVGFKTRNKLFKHFKSISNIKNAKVAEISNLGISRKVAKRIKEKLNQ